MRSAPQGARHELAASRSSAAAPAAAAGRELVPFVVGIAVWQALSSADVWPRVLFPSPLEVAQAFAADIASGVLLVNLGVSLKSLLLGFVVGCAIAMPLGYLMGLSRASRDFFDPLVNLLQAIPGLAWIPFAILWFGLGQGAVHLHHRDVGVLPGAAQPADRHPHGAAGPDRGGADPGRRTAAT